LQYAQSINTIIQSTSKPFKPNFMYLKNLLKVSCFILLCFFAIPAMAQNKTVSGKVTDSKDGSTLIGASIVAKGSTTGAITDVNGTFKLSVPSSATTLVVSYIGYITKEVPITSETINISLEAASNSLNEVLVVGYGTQRKKDQTGSVVKVNSDDFVQGVTTDPLQQLQGKAAGVTISTNSGDPNQPEVVRIHGTASLGGGNDPLYVVDGVAGVDIRTINPNDIESFDILKDASAAAIYGSRASGGIILVTTKHGKAGRLQVSYNTYVASESAQHLIQFADASQYLADYQEANGGASMPTGTTTTSNQGANTNWFKALLRTGFTQSHNLALSGGTDQSHYRASVTYQDQDGIAINSGRQDFNGRFNFDQKALDNKLTITMGLNVDHVNAALSDPAAWEDAASVPSVISEYQPGGAPGQYQYINNTDENNPVPFLADIINTSTSDVIIGNLRLDYLLTPGLTISPYANVIRGTSTGHIYIPHSTLLGSLSDIIGANVADQQDGDEDLASTTSNIETVGITANYKATFGKSKLNLLGGYEFNNYSNTGFHIEAHDSYDVNLPYENLNSFNSVNSVSDLSSYNNGSELKSYFGRAEYNFNDKYYVTGTVRYDWSNKLGYNNQGEVFPSASVGWNISNEDFMKSVTWITSLKLRGGYGQTGDQDVISPYQSQLLFGNAGTATGSSILYYDGASGKWLPANFSIQNQNTLLRWEEKTTVDAAVDFSLFNGRLNGSVDFYNSNTNHLLFAYPVATGGQYFVGTILANVGSLNNKGVDISLNGTIVKSGDFSWNAGGNISLNRNKITNLEGSLPGGDQVSQPYLQVGSTGGLGISGSIANIGYLATGFPVGTLLLPQYAGIDAKGNQLFWHTNADGSRTEVQQAGLTIGNPGSDDRRYYTTDPKFTYGITNTLHYKQFDLNLFMRGNYGSHAFNEVGMDYSTIAGKVGTYSLLASAAAAGINSQPTPSSYWWQSTSFLRVQSATIGYNLIVKDSRYIDRLHIYVGGNNLFTFTSYKGVDPEVNSNVVGGDAGIDVRNGGLYPRTRQLTLGLNLTLK
jgi:TonB-linked SusC/RagA family outer membrane protein